MQTTDYGFLGVGRMGSHMARRLLEAGHPLTVFDLSPQALEALAAQGARRAASMAELGSVAETGFISLPNPDTVHEALLGEQGLASGSRVKCVFDCSTTGPSMAGEVSVELEKRGSAYVDAPVSGGVAGARDGTVAIMVAGPRGVFEQHRSTLAHLGKPFHVGEHAGQGQTMKLANNLLSLGAIALTSEAMVMGVKSGLDPRQMLEVINAGTGRNSATLDKFPRAVLPGTFDFGFAIGLSHKDVRLAVQEADTLGVPMLVGAALLQLIGVTEARFGADADFTSIARVLEEWAGIEVRG
jgi:3-hydroxyisobutyrate dehydrogenase-like beta-hydroxyacid dehydrogenase